MFFFLIPIIFVHFAFAIADCDIAYSADNTNGGKKNVEQKNLQAALLNY